MIENEYTKNELDADLEILGYLFADLIQCKMKNVEQSKEASERMDKILERVREVCDEDECVEFSLEIAKQSFKKGEVPPFARVKAFISKNTKDD